MQACPRKSSLCQASAFFDMTEDAIRFQWAGISFKEIIVTSYIIKKHVGLSIAASKGILSLSAPFACHGLVRSTTSMKRQAILTALHVFPSCFTIAHMAASSSSEPRHRGAASDNRASVVTVLATFWATKLLRMRRSPGRTPENVQGARQCAPTTFVAMASDSSLHCRNV